MVLMDSGKSSLFPEDGYAEIANAQKEIWSLPLRVKKSLMAESLVCSIGRFYEPINFLRSLRSLHAVTTVTTDF